MLTFTEENIKWIVALIEQAQGKTEDEEKKRKLSEISTKVKLLDSATVFLSVTQEDLDNSAEVVDRLKELGNQYSSMLDISDVNIYDNLKKEMTSYLQTLAYYKDLFLNESNTLEDYLKKELKNKLSMMIMEEHIDINHKRPSFTQSEKLAEIDARYLSVKREYTNISQYANTLKTQYDFFIRLWQMVLQSVSVASKESYIGKVNND